MASTADADVQYVNHRYERSVREDGRRCHSWFLIDSTGTEHLAVIGIETDTLDGHYAYNALEPFASRLPLNCGNQSGVAHYLQQWLRGDVDDEEPHSATYSGGTSSGCVTGGTSSGRRKAFVSSLCSSRQAVLNAAGASPVQHHTGGASGRGRPKGKQSAVAAYTAASAPKQKSVGIVQQNQIKKARKIQEDIRAEQDRLITHHLTRLRRGAAAELQGDADAKQVTMSWLQGGLSDEELEALEHWRTLLSTVLDLQQTQQQQQGQAATGSKSCSAQQCEQAGAEGGQCNGQQQQQQQPPAAQLPEQQQQQQQQQQGQQNGSKGATTAGTVPAKLLAWLQQPENQRQYLRVVLECLRELAAADIPARVLLQHKLIALVQRCKSANHQHEAVHALAQRILTRWRWQLAGHMQVLTNPVYMEDHLGVLEEEVAAGQVPLPQLPKYKQVLLSTPLPVLPGGPGSRSTPSHSNHYHHHHHHHHLQQPAGSTPQLYDSAAAGAVGAQGYSGFQVDAAGTGYDAAAAAAAGYLGYNPGNAGFYTPMPSLLGVARAGSPASAPGAMGAAVSGQQHIGAYGLACIPGQVPQYVSGQQPLATDNSMAAGAIAAGVGLAGNGNTQGWQLAAATGAAAPAPTPANSGAYMGFSAAGAANVAAYPGVVWTEQQQQLMLMTMQQQQQ